jgi:hypothetical protein
MFTEVRRVSVGSGYAVQNQCISVKWQPEWETHPNQACISEWKYGIVTLVVFWCTIAGTGHVAV